MKLIYKNALYLIPIFMILVAIIGFSQYISEWEENRWATENELTAFSISIAEFINPYVLKDRTQDEAAQAKKHHILDALREIFSQGMLRSLQIINAENHHVLFEQGEDTFHSPTEMMKKYLLQTKKKPPATVSPLRLGKNEAEPDTMAAISPIYNGREEIAAFVFIEKDASDIAANSRIIIEENIVAAVIALFVGLFAAILLSYLINKPIQNLHHALTYTKDRQEGKPLPVSRIREFGDLNHTYNTMVCVLDEATNRINRELIQGAPFSTNEELAHAYVKEFWPPLKIHNAFVEAYGQLIGHSTRSFFHVQEDENEKIYAFVGQIDYLSEKKFDIVVTENEFQLADIQHEKNYSKTSIASTSISSWITQAIKEYDFETICEELQLFYNLRYFQGITFHFNGDYTFYTYAAGMKTDHSSSHHAQSNEILLLHTFENETDVQLKQFIQLFRNHEVEKVMDEAVPILDPGKDGAMILLRHRSDKP